MRQEKVQAKALLNAASNTRTQAADRRWFGHLLSATAQDRADVECGAHGVWSECGRRGAAWSGVERGSFLIICFFWWSRWSLEYRVEFEKDRLEQRNWTRGRKEEEKRAARSPRATMIFRDG